MCDSLFVSACWQEPRGAGERAGGAAGRPGGLPGLSAASARLLHRHLGLSVLPGHRQLPVFPAEGEYSLVATEATRRFPSEADWALNVQLLFVGVATVLKSHGPVASLDHRLIERFKNIQKIFIFSS